MENDKDKVMIRLLSGCNVGLSVKVHDECYCNFDKNQYFRFSNIINSGLYFPQIMQFISVLICICNGYTSFVDVFLCNLIFGTGYTVSWYLLKLYKVIPGISLISCFIGGNIFRYFLHFVVIGIVALFVIGDWKVILYCLAGGFVTIIVRTILFAKFSTVKYNDEAAIFVSEF